MVSFRSLVWPFEQQLHQTIIQEQYNAQIKRLIDSQQDAGTIKIPTPRFTAYDAFRFGIKMSDDVPMTTQERAYTSPIWYSA